MATSTATQTARMGYNNTGRFGRGERHKPSFDADVPAGVDPEANWRLQSGTKNRRFGTTAAERAGEIPGYTPGYGRASARNRPEGLTDKGAWDSQFKPRGIDPGSMKGDSVVPPVAMPNVFRGNTGDGSDGMLRTPNGSEASGEYAPEVTAAPAMPGAPAARPMFSWDANYPKATTQQPDRSMNAPTRQVRFNNPKSLIIPPGGNATDAQRFAAEAANLKQNQQMVDPNNNPFKTEVTAPKPEQWQSGTPGAMRTTTNPQLGTQVNQAVGLPKGQTASASFVPGQNSPANLAKRPRKPIDPLT